MTILTSISDYIINLTPIHAGVLMLIITFLIISIAHFYEAVMFLFNSFLALFYGFYIAGRFFFTIYNGIARFFNRCMDIAQAISEFYDNHELTEEEKLYLMRSYAEEDRWLGI